jgi:hypothetical protein
MCSDCEEARPRAALTRRAALLALAAALAAGGAITLAHARAGRPIADDCDSDDSDPACQDSDTHRGERKGKR